MSKIEKLQQAVNEYLDDFDDKDSMILMVNSGSEMKSIMVSDGDPEILSHIISQPAMIMDFNTENYDDYVRTQKVLMNIVFNICHQNKEYRDKFIQGLYSFDVN